MVLARFGPRLPALVENALIAQTQKDDQKNNGLSAYVLPALLGAGFGVAATLVAIALS